MIHTTMKNANYHRSNSLYKRARDSFYRSQGGRGANIEMLRGDSGADFECEAIVHRGKFSRVAQGGSSLLRFLTKFQRNQKDYLVVKGPFIFVYSSLNSPSPKFAIPLKHQIVQVHDHSSYGGDRKRKTQVVSLQTVLGDVQYEIKFDSTDNEGLGKTFGNVLKEQIRVGDCNEIKEKLSHDGLQHKSKSMIFARTIAEKKENEQPPKQDLVRVDDAMPQYGMMMSVYY